ncbi:MAG TPA: hypothetical protein ENJ80_05475 [Gammaproteobacteria bacterium]|nr:hypothetical protein [Gammaproteobacteria bacterium]
MIHRYLPVLCCLPAVLVAGEVQQYTNPDTGLLSWQIKEPGFSMQLLQVLPDYVRATYSARGLPPEVVDTIAGYCVFGTIVTNDTDHQVSYRVSDWRYITADGKAHPVKTKTQWVNEWKDQGVAFRWSILPDDQTFEPGDWSQGFTTLPLPPGTVVDLVYSWRDQGETHEGKLEGLRCAPAELP